jgi:hypothetical protein
MGFWISTQVLSYIIGGFILYHIFWYLLVRGYFGNQVKSKTGKGNKTLIRVKQNNEEEVSYLLDVNGIKTEPNEKGKSYVLIPRKQDKKTGKQQGSTFETLYPEGVPRIFQHRIRGADAREGNPMTINYYGDEVIPKMTDTEVATLHREKFSEMAAKLSEDTEEFFKKWKEMGKNMINKTVVYLGLGLIVVIVGIMAYLTIQNGAAISDLKSLWGF